MDKTFMAVKATGEYLDDLVKQNGTADSVRIMQCKNITGQKFGRLSVIEFSHKGLRRDLYWKCKCDCGIKVIVRASDLRSGNTRSCGCYKIELLSRRHKPNNEAIW